MTKLKQSASLTINDQELTIDYYGKKLRLPIKELAGLHYLLEEAILYRYAQGKLITDSNDIVLLPFKVKDILINADN